LLTPFWELHFKPGACKPDALQKIPRSLLTAGGLDSLLNDVWIFLRRLRPSL